MKRLLLPVVALALLALLVLLLQGDGTGSAGESRESSSETHPVETAAPIETAPAIEGGGPVDGGRHALAPGTVEGGAHGTGEPVATVRARLVDENGDALPGARLAVILAERNLEEDHVRMLQFFEAVDGGPTPELDRYESLADADGVATVPLPKEAGLLVAVAAEERRQAAFTRMPWEHGKPLYDLGELTLPGGCALEVDVRDARGRPIAGARVIAYGELDFRADRLPFHILSTGADGSVRFGHLAPGNFQVVAHHAEHAVGEHEVGALEAGELQQATIQLETGGSITGLVVDAGGSGAEGVPIFVEDESPRRGMLDPLQFLLGEEPSATSDADGRFAVNGIASGKRYRVRARRSADLEASAEGVRAGEEVRLELPVEATIRGRIVTAAGSPAAGAKVQIIPLEDGRHFGTEGVYEADEDGAFEALVSDADYRVAAWHASGEERWATVFEVRGELDAGELRLSEGGDLELTVLAEVGGRPLGGARIRESDHARHRLNLQSLIASASGGSHAIEQTAEDRARDRVLRNGRPDATEISPGVYEWKGIRPGLHAFSVEADGHPESLFELEIRPGARTRHTVHLVSGATLIVTATRSGGQPASDTFLSLTATNSQAPSRPAIERVDAEGTATFEDLRPGSYQLFEGFTFGGSSEEPLQTVDLVAGENVLTVLLEARFDLLVRVVDAAGPVAGASVEVTTANQGFERLLRMAAVGADGDRTDENGEHLATELEAGSHTVRASRDGGYPSEAEVELLGPGQEVVVLLSGFTVSGTVEGAPEGCEVELSGVSSASVDPNVLSLDREALVESLLIAAGDQHTATVPCTPDGRFVFHDVPDGEYELTANAPGRVAGEPVAASVAGGPVGGLHLTTLAAGKVALLVDGIRGVARFRARIVDPAGATVGGEQRIRQNGRYDFEDVPAGTWTLRIEPARRNQQPLAEFTVLVSGGAESLVEWSVP